MASFDIKSLCTQVPVKEVINDKLITESEKKNYNMINFDLQQNNYQQ